MSEDFMNRPLREIGLDEVPRWAQVVDYRASARRRRRRVDRWIFYFSTCIFVLAIAALVSAPVIFASWLKGTVLSDLAGIFKYTALSTIAVLFVLSGHLLTAGPMTVPRTGELVFDVPISNEVRVLYAILWVDLLAIMYVYTMLLAIAYAILFAVTGTVLIEIVIGIYRKWWRRDNVYATMEDILIPSRVKALPSSSRIGETPPALTSDEGVDDDSPTSEQLEEVNERVPGDALSGSSNWSRASSPRSGSRVPHTERLLPSDQAELKKFPRELRNALLLIPRDGFTFIRSHNKSLPNWAKRQIEHLTGYVWNWWPFAPSERPLEAGHIRVKWSTKGFSGAMDLIQTDSRTLLELLQRLPSHPPQCLCCRVERIKVPWESLQRRFGGMFTKTLSRFVRPITLLSLNLDNKPTLYERKVKHGLIFTLLITFSIMAMMIIGYILSAALAIVGRESELTVLPRVYIHNAVTFSTKLTSVGNIMMIYFPSFVVMQLVGIYAHEMYFWITKPVKQGAQGDTNNNENASPINSAHTLLSIATTSRTSDAASSALPSENQGIENDSTSNNIGVAGNPRWQPKWVLFGVSGVSKYPTLDQIPVVRSSTDKSFFCDLLRSYRSQRGWFALCFSPFTLANCRSVEFLLMNIGCLISIAGRLPEGRECGHEYCYHPRPPKAQLPLVSKDEFGFYLSICPKNCIRRVWVPWHTCTILAGGIEQRDERLLQPEPNLALPVLTRLPKKRTKYQEWSLYTINKPAYGIETEYELSLMAVTVYHTLLILPSLGFWVYWLYYHPGDLQNASVPVLTTLGLIGSTWAALGFTKK